LNLRQITLPLKLQVLLFYQVIYSSDEAEKVSGITLDSRLLAQVDEAASLLLVNSRKH
jgi:hypothetical protein